jgi:Asp-tRNA(Asn)/Glu-tRNA(Gln) amidotransferase A subunit family amidase
MKRALKSIPKFKTEAEERAFWETHDSTEYVDWSTAQRVRFPNLKPSTQAISLRLPVSLLEQIKVEANRRDVPYQSLIKVWLAEKAEQGQVPVHGLTSRSTRPRPAAYDQVLAAHDLLLMPTTPMKTSKIPERRASFLAVMKHCWEMIVNTAAFDLTGHPSLSVPCGLGEGDRPIGLMLTGRHFDEATVYRAAYAFEQSGDWQTMR